MPRKAQKSKLTWSKDGPVAAQLFRDLYFKKYQIDPTTGKFNINEIYRDPTRPFKDLNQTSFPKHVTSTWERVQAYRDQGTGLGSEKFRTLVRLHEPPQPEDQAPASDIFEEEEDSAYQDEDEDDIDLFGFESDSGCSEANANGEIKDVLTKDMSDKNTPKKSAPVKPIIVDNSVKYSFSEPDGRLAYVYHVPSGFDGTFELDEANTKVMKKEIMQPWSYSAEAVYSRLGLTAQNVHVVGLQAVMDAKKRRDIAAMGQNADEYEGQIFVRTVAFDLGEEVEPYFIDHAGEETTDVWIDASDHGGEWVFFWLKKKQSRGGRSARLNRNRNRRRTGDGEAQDSPASQRNRVDEFDEMSQY
eukprot:scaffold26354_cov205-Amphora_coffeaeformis.AAC.1